MTETRIPLIVLGGRDHELTAQADNGRGRRPLLGYKGADIRINGRPLIQILIDRMKATGIFDPVLVAGPRRVYDPFLEGADVVDTDGGFGENLRTSVEWAREHLKPEMLAVTTCDILPDTDELAAAAEDLCAHMPLDYWMPQIQVPEDSASLGASEWKPKYRLVPRGESRSVPILPGHMIVCNPEAVRLSFVYRFFDLLYRTRNRPMAYRRIVLTRRLLWSLVVEDLKRIASLRLPRVFVTVVYNGLLLASRLKAGVAGVAEAEYRIRRSLIQVDHQRRHPELRGRVFLCPALSLAKDIDTEEEARELETRAALATDSLE